MFKEKVKELMKSQNMTQKELADRSGITEASISRYLNGDRTPRIDIIINFAKVFKVDVDFLISDDEEIKKMEDSYTECRTVLARNAKCGVGCHADTQQESEVVEYSYSAYLHAEPE